MLFTYIPCIIFAILAMLSSTRTATIQPPTEPNAQPTSEPTQPKSPAHDADLDALLQRSIDLQVLEGAQQEREYRTQQRLQRQQARAREQERVALLERFYTYERL